MAHTTQNRRDSLVTLLSDDDLHYFNEGTHLRMYDKLGAHGMTVQGQSGTYFAVWAPNAARVSVVGSFNGWQPAAHPLRLRGTSGIWEGFMAGVGPGTLYKYHLTSHYHNYHVNKADPYGFAHEVPPHTASIVTDLTYHWGDQDWMAARARRPLLTAPLSIYEMHLGSWRHAHEESWRSLSYRELAVVLADYVQQMGFTHVEFLPIMEHPFYASWGYQITGYFAPTRRYGSPTDFMYLVDYLHQRGIGVILDWVPSHFPTDEHGLGFFDGTHVYEHADERQGLHPDWQSAIFNYGRHEVQSFLLSNALFWLEQYHVDGLRLDAVASMLYLDYSRQPGEWVPNQYGGRENLEAIAFLRRCNEVVGTQYPGVYMIAEESTSWPMVSKPPYVGGLGFHFKWDMGWMHDTLDYLHLDPIFRKYDHNLITFRQLYSNSENFVLPLSHDEVVHGKSSLLGKMPGDDWQKFANLRLLLGYMYAQPGKKLLFMGGELAQWREWNHDTALDWHLLAYAPHQGIQRWVADLNQLYRQTPALHEGDCDPEGFSWIDCNDTISSVVSLLRYNRQRTEAVMVVCNFTPVPRLNYGIGVPDSGTWREVLNSDALEYGGSGCGNAGQVNTLSLSQHGRPYTLVLTLPPLGLLFFKSPLTGGAPGA
ncbi:MAG: 1,4-alpha-glucan branching protein GlgB [Candidatus Tectimicrobiota bacterium]